MGAYFFISKLTLVVWPALTSTSLVCLPRVSCHTSTVCLPGGTFSILATPLASVTAAGPGVTATQPRIQLWTSQVSFTYSGFSSFSVITFLNFGWALLIEGLAVEYVWMLCRMSSEFLSSRSPGFIAMNPGDLELKNSDDILHNIHTYSTANPSINKAQPKFKKVMTEKLEKPEYVKLTCDVHSWMLGWVAVTPGPAAVTDANGVAKIENVPPGKQTVEVWHETLGKQTKDVEVKAGQTTK